MPAREYLSSQAYLDYLIANCGVRGYDVGNRTEASARPDVEVILRYCKLLEPQSGDRLLEVGCGIGRILMELNAIYGLKPYGIDLTPTIVEAARMRVSGITSDIRASPAEAISHRAASFDKVLCWGTFDLTEQEQSLPEMARVTVTGGKILVTGKNDRYHDDDSEARIAEEKSREKGIPNHYTDFDGLLRLARAVGLEPRRTYFFERRGDFMNDHGREDRPERFYEWLVLFDKARHVEPSTASSTKICDLYSRTYGRRAAAL